ncbi:MAG: hypothetical protein IPQ15_16295 [Betaproteobacteria bacterium]|nr:hypothetical protein [Betaproteobacteria bacterium]
MTRKGICGNCGSLALAGYAEAIRTYNTWSSNESPNGNYILTITETGESNLFNWNLTVNPWNAEALGLFVDLGAVTDPTPCADQCPSHQGSWFRHHTTSDGCGEGCNLNGLSLPALGGGDCELMFRLADNGTTAFRRSLDHARLRPDRSRLRGGWNPASSSRGTTRGMQATRPGATTHRVPEPVLMLEPG